MFKHLKKQSGFTLIELLIVIIIVAILAVAAVSLMRGNTEAARLSEGVSGLGNIRTNMRAELAENNAYPTGTGFAAGNRIVDAGIGFNVEDFCGRFFGDNSYTWGTATTATTYCARVQGLGANGTCVAGGAPRGSQIATTVNRSMNELGHLFASADCTGIELN